MLAAIGGFAVACSASNGERSGSTKHADTTTSSQQFNVYAKSSIETVSTDPAAENEPAGANDVAFRALLFATNAAYQENPPDEFQSSGQFRIFTSIGLLGTCQTTTDDSGNVTVSTQQPQILGIATAAGNEGPFPGQVDPLQTSISQDGGGFDVLYVLSGSPNQAAEVAFGAVAQRTNRSIFQVGAIHVDCDSSGNPIAWVAWFFGTDFPSHHLWIDDNNSQNLDAQYLHQSGMGALWNLPSVPTL